MRRSLRYYHIIVGAALMTAVLLGSLFFWAYSGGYYHSSQQRYGIPEVTGIAQQDLDRISRDLIDYMRGRRADLMVTAPVNGREEAVFSEREILHMEDVRMLLKLTERVCTASALLAALALLFWAVRRRFRDLFLSALCAAGLFAVLGLCTLILSFVDFSAAFTYFHRLVFTNDLWMLNPRTDVLLQMMPLPFFSGMVIRTVLSAAVLLTVTAGAFRALLRRGGESCDH